MSDVINVRGVAYIRVSGGDAADASWEKGRISSMGFNPVVRETGEDNFAIYLPTSEAKDYIKQVHAEQISYWHSSEGISELKRFGQEEKEYLRSPEGRYDKRQNEQMERAMRRGEY